MSVCPLCPDQIHIGTRISKLPGRGWAHLTCINAASQDDRPDPGGEKGTTP